MKIREYDWITTKQKPNVQVEVLSVGQTLYCADLDGNGVEINVADVVTCGSRHLRPIFEKSGTRL